MAEQIAFDVLARDVSGSRTFNKFGEAVEGASDKVTDLAVDSALLAKQIENVEDHLEDLRREFARTGDISLKKLISGSERDLAFLQKVKKGLTEVADEAHDAGKKAGKALTGGIADALGALPAQLKGAAIVGGVAVGAVLAPALGATISAAVLGSVGGGGILGGIALAAQDPEVKAAGADLGQYLMGGLAAAGQEFVGPLLDNFDELRGAGDDLISSLRGGFRTLAPTLTPLVRGVQGLVRNLQPGLADAFEAAAPAIRAIAHELPEIGAAISDALSAISEESDGAILALTEILHILEDAIVFVGEFSAAMSSAFEWMVKNGYAVTAAMEQSFGWVPVLGGALRAVNEEDQALLETLQASKDASDDYAGSMDGVYRALNDTAKAAELARNAMMELAESIEDQFDPTANLIHRLQDVKDAQKEYNEAVKEHGRNSKEAQAAQLELAESIIAANSAAAAAQGTFDGKFTPAMRKILKEGGLTEQQIREIEAQFRSAQAAGERFAKSYKAQLVLDTRAFYGSLAAAANAANGGEYISGRASGGPVAAGKTYMVGEEGPELVTFGANGYVHNATQTQAMLSGTAGGAAGWGGGGTTQILVSAKPGAGQEFLAWLLPLLRYEVRTAGGGDAQAYWTGGGA